MIVEITLNEGCGKFFFEILLLDVRKNTEFSRFVVVLKPDEVVEAFLNGPKATKEVLGKHARSPRSADALVDVLQSVLDFKKDDHGLWTPKFKPGDVVILDRPNSPEIRVLDADDGSYERVPKSPTEMVATKSCTCPARDLLTKGCSCGGRRLPPGLRELPR